MATPTVRNSRRRSSEAGGGGRLAARIVAGAGIGILLSVLVVRVGLADIADADERYVAAAAIDPDQPEAALGMADEAIITHRGADAESAARTALAARPLSVQALRDLALARRLQGDRTGEARLFGQSAALGWRNLISQMWLVEASASARAYDVTIQRLDGIARQNLGPDQVALIDGLAQDPEFRAILVARLAASPPWRTTYLRSFADQTALPTREAILLALAATPAPPNRDELAPVVRGIGALDVGRARALWLATGSGPNPGTLFDSGFEAPPVDPQDRVPFDWTLVSSGDGTATVEPSPDGQGHALHAQADSGATGILAYQLVDLPAGIHDFTIAARGSAASLDALRWSVDCLAATDDNIGIGRTLTGNGAWKLLRIRFEVPKGCYGQRLTLRASSTNDGQATDGWYDTARIDGR